MRKNLFCLFIPLPHCNFKTSLSCSFLSTASLTISSFLSALSLFPPFFPLYPLCLYFILNLPYFNVFPSVCCLFWHINTQNWHSYTKLYFSLFMGILKMAYRIRQHVLYIFVKHSMQKNDAGFTQSH